MEEVGLEEEKEQKRGDIVPVILSNKPEFRRYSGAEIRAMRLALKESRKEFGCRFLLSAAAIKKYELGKREAWGPVIVILGQIEKEVEARRELRRKTLENVRAGRGARLSLTTGNRHSK